MLGKERGDDEGDAREEAGGRGERNFTPVAGNFTLLLGQVSKTQLVLVENVVPVCEFSSPSLLSSPLPSPVPALKAC